MLCSVPEQLSSCFLSIPCGCARLAPLSPSKYSYLAVSGVQVQCTIVMAEVPVPAAAVAQIEWIDMDAQLGSRRLWNVELQLAGQLNKMR